MPADGGARVVMNASRGSRPGLIGPRGWPLDSQASSDATSSGRERLRRQIGDSSSATGFDSTVDLFGEHSVQVVASIATTLTEAALVLTLVALLVLLSVRVARQSACGPLPASVRPHVSRTAPPADDADNRSGRRLSTSLPTRAPPPDPVQRLRPSPSGDSVAG